MRDAYGTEAELPHLRKWLAGEPVDTDWLEPWFALVRAGTAAGKVFKRARIVSEPVSDYQKWVLQDSHRYVEAGEDIRWVPRSRVSAVALPGNDFWLFDDEVVVFLIFAAKRPGGRSPAHDRPERSPALPVGVRGGVGAVDPRP
jgi:Family of unknown function (DUF6879)